MATLKVKIGTITIQSGTENTAYVSWELKPAKDWTNTQKSRTDKFEYQWQYLTDRQIWFEGSTGSVDYPYHPLNCTYSIPDNATKIRVRVRPVAKTHKVNKADQPWYSGSWTSPWVTANVTAIELPEVPSINAEMQKSKLSMSCESYDTKTKQIEFEVVVDNARRYGNTIKVDVSTNHAATTINVPPGHSYKVRARGLNSKTEGNWSNYTSEVYSSPTAPQNVKAVAESANSIRVTWNKVDNATEYEIEYTTNRDWFDTNLDNVSSTTISSGTTLLMTPEEIGKTYFFRVRATANEGDASEWSAIKDTTVGKIPEAPTTWSMTTTARVGDTLYLYWTHNSEDGSRATYSELEVIVNGEKLQIDPIKNDKTEDEDTGTYLYTLDTQNYSYGSKVKWRVRTKGVLNTPNNGYGDWSIQREIDVYAAPTLQVELGSAFHWFWDELNFPTGSIDETAGAIDPLVDDIMTSFPLWISLESGPTMQTPIGYVVSIVAAEDYDGTDMTGEPVHIISGQEVFSRYYPKTAHSLVVGLKPGDIMLEDGITYIVNATVSMDSGLTAQTPTDQENAIKFTVSWENETYLLEAGVVVDNDTLVASITPYCQDDGELVEGITLGVFRRNADGSFTEIMSNLDNTAGYTIIDPHPTLDAARYRITALSSETGRVFFSDIKPEEVNETCIVVQWDEHWSGYNYDEEDPSTNRPWSGTMLKLPYNVDISDSNNIDVEFAEYIGRQHPVSYYGTQKGTKSSWKTDIVKEDEETIELLRRLANYMGDVYVREPYGTGYWAQVNVQFELKHNSIVTPVSLEVTRVEGGI